MPDYSDEATGLPPLDVKRDEVTLLALDWTTSAGVARNPLTDETYACRYLHVRGLTPTDSGEPEWAQGFIAIPVAVCHKIAEALTQEADP